MSSNRFVPRFLLLVLPLVLLVCGLAPQPAWADDRSLSPKYGSSPKSEAEQLADERLLERIDQLYGGDRKKAAQVAAQRGWETLRQRNPDEAMRRFNQAWLLDSSNGQALWGMGAIQGAKGKTREALGLFQEAELSLGDDVDFAVDYARTIGMAGFDAKDDALSQQAFERFASIQKRAPQHTLNLQNWAIALFYAEKYAEAWEKIQLAQATPRRAELDPEFIAALAKKLPRP